MIDVPTLDCEDCGTGIEFVVYGKVQPDAEVYCPTCGAVHVVNCGEAGDRDSDVWLTLVKHGAEVIAELQAQVAALAATIVDAGDALAARAATAGASIPWAEARTTLGKLSPSRGACAACGEDTEAFADGRRCVSCGAVMF